MEQSAQCWTQIRYFFLSYVDISFAFVHLCVSLRSFTIIKVTNQPVNTVIQCWILFGEHELLLCCLCISITEASNIFLFLKETFSPFCTDPGLNSACFQSLTPKYSSIQHAHAWAHQFRETECCCLEKCIQNWQFISCFQLALILTESKHVHRVFTDISHVVFVFTLRIKLHGKIRNLLFIQPHWFTYVWDIRIHINCLNWSRP